MKTAANHPIRFVALTAAVTIALLILSARPGYA